MTTSHRKLLDKFAVGDRPLNRAIKAVLEEVDRLRSEAEHADDCPGCGGTGARWYALRGVDVCLNCRGTGTRR